MGKVAPMSRLIRYALVAAALGGCAGFLFEFAISFARSLKDASDSGAIGWMAALIFRDIFNGIRGGLIGAFILALLGLVTGMFAILLRESGSKR